MRFLIILICILSMGPIMEAQTGISTGGMGFRVFQKPGDVFQRFNEFGLTQAEFNAIKNGMYPNPNYLPGSIYENGKEMVRDLPMRYNAYTDEIEVKEKRQSEDYQTLEKNENVSVKIAYDPYIYLPDNGIKEKSGFMNVLVDGEKYKLYKKETVTFHPLVKAQTGYDSDSPARFTQNVYYYLVQNGNLMDIPSRKSKVVDMLENENSGMKSYIKKSKLDVRKEAGLKKAVEHLDTL